MDTKLRIFYVINSIHCLVVNSLLFHAGYNHKVLTVNDIEQNMQLNNIINDY